MSVIILLIVAGGMVASGFLAAFVWAVKSGQFDDTCTPAVRVLLDPHNAGSRASDPSIEPTNYRANEPSTRIPT